MKRFNRINESLSKEQAISEFKKMTESEKTGWIKIIRECIKELGYGSIATSDIVTGSFGVGLIVVGVRYKLPALCLMGAAAIGAISHFEKDVWSQIIKCAQAKKKGIPTIKGVPSVTDNDMTTNLENMTEGRRKKIIRLTESDLENIVKKVLTEQVITKCIENGDTLCPIKCKIKVARKNCPNSHEVKEIQHALAKGGYFKGEGGGMSKKCATDVEACDGIFDWRTKQAVVEFQKSGKGGSLTADGVVGYKTLEGLVKAGLINDPQCDCKQQSDNNYQIPNKPTDGNNWYVDISPIPPGPHYRDCDVIKHCLMIARKSPGKEWDAFLRCMASYNRQGGNDNNNNNNNNLTDCPDYINCMPSVGKDPDPRCKDIEAFKKYCPGTQIAY